MLCVILHKTPGQTAEGVLLALSKDRMRIAVPATEDTLELRRVNGCWSTEDGVPVEFEALLSNGEADTDVFTQAYPRVLTVGRG